MNRQETVLVGVDGHGIGRFSIRVDDDGLQAPSSGAENDRQHQADALVEGQQLILCGIDLGAC